MLNDATGFKKIFIATGYTDLRKGVDGLSGIIKNEFKLNPAEKDVIFLFCGRRTDRIKAIIWEGDGFLLLYKKLAMGGAFAWPRNEKEVRSITGEQFHNLMKGMEIVARRPIYEISAPDEYM